MDIFVAKTCYDSLVLQNYHTYKGLFLLSFQQKLHPWKTCDVVKIPPYGNGRCQTQPQTQEKQGKPSENHARQRERDEIFALKREVSAFTFCESEAALYIIKSKMKRRSTRET